MIMMEDNRRKSYTLPSRVKDLGGQDQNKIPDLEGGPRASADEIKQFPEYGENVGATWVKLLLVGTFCVLVGYFAVFRDADAVSLRRKLQTIATKPGVVVAMTDNFRQYYEQGALDLSGMEVDLAIEQTQAVQSNVEDNAIGRNDAAEQVLEQAIQQTKDSNVNWLAIGLGIATIVIALIIYFWCLYCWAMGHMGAKLRKHILDRKIRHKKASCCCVFGVADFKGNNVNEPPQRGEEDNIECALCLLGLCCCAFGCCWETNPLWIAKRTLEYENATPRPDVILYEEDRHRIIVNLDTELPILVKGYTPALQQKHLNFAAKKRRQGKIPVYLTKGTGSIPTLSQKKYLINEQMTVGEMFQDDYITHGLGQKVFFGNTLPTESLVSTIYEKHKADDGYLYMTYSAEKSEG